MSPETLLYVVVVSIMWLFFFSVRSVRPRQVLMVFASCILYGSWGLGFLALLMLSSVMNYALAKWLRRHASSARLWVGIILNVALLSTFKYLPGIASLSSHTSIDAVFRGVVLPVGISFWTLQAISYLLDVYRGEGLEPSLLEFLLYMTFWPTVLSGPICRFSNLLPQFRNSTTPTAVDLRAGFDRICIGLVMTALGQVLAGGIHLGQGLDDAFNDIPRGWGGSDVWCMAIGYGFELFFNFAGYSHIVIGAARLFGIRLDENFARPYVSVTPSEFWTRWHMSLSFWIRDYVFLPLALLRREKWWRNIALLLSMVLFGLWHKGTVLFVLWGFYQGALLVLHRLWQGLQRRFEWKWPHLIPEFVSWLVTFSAICLGWVFFRSNTVSQAFTLLRAAITPSSYGSHVLPPSLYFTVFACFIGYFATIGVVELHRRSVGMITSSIELRLAFYAVAVYIGVLHTLQSQPFVYFQF
jgi:alginate O-acetyltransferase complex protein AlgI